MKRYLILTLVSILAISMLFGGCSNSNQEQRLAELEQQNKGLTQQINELQQQNEELAQQINELTAPPKLLKTIDKSVTLMANPSAWIPALASPPFYEGIIYDGYFAFSVLLGNRVEGEVTTPDPNWTFARVLDPNGNRLLETKYNQRTGYAAQDYPWKFAFTADMAGDYTFQVDTGIFVLSGPSLPTAHVSICIYDK